MDFIVIGLSRRIKWKIKGSEIVCSKVLDQNIVGWSVKYEHKK